LLDERELKGPTEEEKRGRSGSPKPLLIHSKEGGRKLKKTSSPGLNLQENANSEGKQARSAQKTLTLKIGTSGFP